MEATPVKSYGSSRETVEFTFTAPGSGTSVTVPGGVEGTDIVSSIAHVGGTNVLTVTLNRAFNKFVHGTVSVIATGGKRATVASVTNEGNGSNFVFTIETQVAAGTADNDSAARLTVQLHFRRRSTGVK